MDLAKFSAFKYQHPGRGVMTRGRRWFLGLSLAGAAGVAVVLFPGGLAAFLVPLIAWLSAPKKLFIGPRYLICGRDIVYFNNVVKLALDESAGALTLTSANGKTFTLQRDKFPTNARKAPKVAANRAAKFAKATGKLVEKVVQASPDVERLGVSRTGQALGG